MLDQFSVWVHPYTIDGYCGYRVVVTLLVMGEES